MILRYTTREKEILRSLSDMNIINKGDWAE